LDYLIFIRDRGIKGILILGAKGILVIYMRKNI